MVFSHFMDGTWSCSSFICVTLIGECKKGACFIVDTLQELHFCYVFNDTMTIKGILKNFFLFFLFYLL